MFAHELKGHFAAGGARLEVHGWLPSRWGPPRVVGQPDQDRYRGAFRNPFQLDIKTDKLGEHFELLFRTDAPDFRILNARKDERHLLLYAKHNGQRDAERLLCGHDERHWFVAGIGEQVSTVIAARRALLPPQLRNLGLNVTTIQSRSNPVFKRQGEWFFLPVQDIALLNAIGASEIHRNEPIQRGPRSKPHRVEHLVRFGGVDVRLYNGKEYSPEEWDAFIQEQRRKQAPPVRAERRMKDMKVYVRGNVRHPDHATICLRDWHEVLMNEEKFYETVTFYD